MLQKLTLIFIFQTFLSTPNFLSLKFRKKGKIISPKHSAIHHKLYFNKNSSKMYQNLQQTNLFLHQSDFFHFRLEELLQQICTPEVLRLWAIIQTAVGHNSIHVSNEESLVNVIKVFQSSLHCLEI